MAPPSLPATQLNVPFDENVVGEVENEEMGDEEVIDDNDDPNEVIDDGVRAHRRRMEPERYGDIVVGGQYERCMGNICGGSS